MVFSTFAALLLLAAAPPRPQGQAPNWLHPSASEFQFAIDQGYSLKPKVRFKTIEVGALRPILRIVPPLGCAEEQAAEAARRLAPKPTVDAVESECRGLMVRYQAPRTGPNATFAVLLVHHGETLEPAMSAIDNAPRPEYRGVDYGVITSYRFDPPEAWADKVEVRYSDGSKASAKTINLADFAKDEASHRVK